MSFVSAQSNHVEKLLEIVTCLEIIALVTARGGLAAGVWCGKGGGGGVSNGRLGRIYCGVSFGP